MKRVRLSTLGAVALVCSGTQPVMAAAPLVQAGSIYLFRDDRGANDVGINSGDRLQYGANILGGSTGVTITGIAGTGFDQGTSPCSPLSVNPDFCSQSSTFNSSRLDPWTIQFARGSQVTTVTTPSAVGVSRVPFPTSVTLSGHGLTPTITWAVPGGLTPDGFRVNVFDKGVRLANGQADIIYTANLDTHATSFTLPGTLGLKATGNYVINFQLIDTRGGVPLPPGAGNEAIFSRSSSFFDFTPLTGSVPTDVALPTIDSAGVYHFDVGDVGPDHVTFIDPAVATGYSYAIGAGGPDFKSVLLPDVGDGEYTLTYVDGTGSHSVDVRHDEQFFFGGDGVAAFTVTGIEAAAGLDPSNGTAFVTGLTFAAGGDFTGTMVPITTDVTGVVPEPASGLLLLAGLGLLGATVRRRRPSA